MKTIHRVLFSLSQFSPPSPSAFMNRNRASLKSLHFINSPNWKDKLRENCFKRVREDRSRLLWKLRTPNENFISSAFRDIVSDELEKINNASSSPSAPQVDDDILWEYDGLHHAYQGDCEEILIEMQRIFYDDLQQHSTSIDSESQELTWEDEEDEYLARAVYEHMQLNGEQNKVWCPICKQGELQENKNIINCTLCELKLNKADEVNLGILKDRLAELHAEHFDRGCRLTPKFCIEDKFGLTALYIICDTCCTFEIVI